MPVEFNCTNCGKKSEKTPSNMNESGNNFCSVQCFNNWDNPDLYETLTCAGCGEEFDRLSSQIKTRENSYCSEDCRAENKSITIVCQTCGDAFERPESQSTDAKYCSKKCMGKGLRKKVKESCTNCGEQVTRQPSDVKGKENIFCSNECRLSWVKDTATYDWKNTRNYGPNWKEKREAVRDRDSHTCQECGIAQDELGYTLRVHHIKHFDTFDNYKEANRLENLVTLCEKCHKQVESNEQYAIASD